MNVAVELNVDGGFKKMKNLSAGLYEIEDYPDWLLVVPNSVQNDCFWINISNNSITGQAKEACMLSKYKKSNRKITLSND